METLEICQNGVKINLHINQKLTFKDKKLHDFCTFYTACEKCKNLFYISRKFKSLIN